MKLFWCAFLLLCIGASIADGLASAVTISSILQARNLLALIFIYPAGYIITALVVFSKEILSSSSTFLKFLWGVAIIVDLYTTIMGTIWYIILGNPLATTIDISQIGYDFRNVVPTVTGFLVVFMVTGLSVATLYVYERCNS